MKVTASQVTVSTIEYRLSHGREPKGRGCWAFTFGKRDAETTDDYKWFSGTYCEARKQARKAAAEAGETMVYTQP